MAKTAGRRLPRAVYEAELERLQLELARMQTWVREEGARVVIVFEGRDAAGKGSAIKRIVEPLNPRWCRIAALPAPAEPERTQWYFQRYIAHLPSAGEIVLFDRSWYNRAGVEHVLGFCTTDQYRLFMRQCPVFERMLIEDGMLFTKYWFSVSDGEQRRRFQERIDDPTKRWKLSPMDLESRAHYVDYSRAKDEMFVQTDLPDSPWFVVEADDKRRARINCIAHLLTRIPYEHRTPRTPKRLPRRQPDGGYVRPPFDEQTLVPDHAAGLSLTGRGGAARRP
jgi:polyphosphate kinase 2